jgi:hypothetical protein
VAAFPEAMRQAVKILLPGFTVLADLRNLGIATAQRQYLAEGQRILGEAGMARVASVWGDQALERMKIGESAQSSGGAHYATNRKEFLDISEAIIWLDEA